MTRDPELRAELLALFAEDQAARHAVMAESTPENSARVEAADLRSTARMKEIIERGGWPGTSLVGRDGANAAWCLVQHADRDLAFQKQCLPLVERAAHDGEAEPAHHAYLYDRIAVAEGRPQRYGTQYGPDARPQPIASTHVVPRSASSRSPSTTRRCGH
jgi:hypothetical protein